MSKQVLKAISLIATVGGAALSVAGAVASAKLQDLELDEKVIKAFEKMSK